ncbi:hypothetical protein YQE_05826, partial [Dendroctonus ponderosae]
MAGKRSPLNGFGSGRINEIFGKRRRLNYELQLKAVPEQTRSVSWIRHRDLHLLTVNRFTYTSDQRFSALHNPHTEDWTLQVRYPQRRDAGTYECQVATTPPIGHSMYLSVVAPLECIVA